MGYNAFNVYRRELAPGTVSLTGDRAQGDDSKHWAYSKSMRSNLLELDVHVSELLLLYSFKYYFK